MCILRTITLLYSQDFSINGTSGASNWSQLSQCSENQFEAVRVQRAVAISLMNHVKFFFFITIFARVDVCLKQMSMKLVGISDPQVN